MTSLNCLSFLLPARWKKQVIARIQPTQQRRMNAKGIVVAKTIVRVGNPGEDLYSRGESFAERFSPMVICEEEKEKEDRKNEFEEKQIRR